MQVFNASGELQTYNLHVANITGRRLDNLCRNAAFASRSGGTSAVPDEWTLEGTPTVAYDTVDTGYGDFAVKFTASGAGDEGINQTLTHLKASTNYQVFARVKVTAGDTASLITTGATTNINEDSTSTSWEDITGQFTTDASGTDVVIKLVASADTDVADFCGITCVEGAIPPANFIRRVNEVIYLTTAITDTSWNGDSFSDAEADIDLSAFGNGCPPKIKAVLLSVNTRDSGSAPKFVEFGPGGISIDGVNKVALGNRADGLASDTLRMVSGWIPCDANGDIRYKIDASGSSTMDVWINIWGYVLGE